MELFFFALGVVVGWGLKSHPTPSIKRKRVEPYDIDEPLTRQPREE